MSYAVHLMCAKLYTCARTRLAGYNSYRAKSHATRKCVNTVESRVATLTPMQRRPRWKAPGWTTVGIRTKILVPLILLMLLSLLGSTAGFIISTDTTRNSILDRQLGEDAYRVRAAIEQQTRDAVEGGHLLARDRVLLNALTVERLRADRNTATIMVERVVTVHDRLGIDQIMLVDSEGRIRVNVAPSHLESISVNGRKLLPTCRTKDEIALVNYQNHPLLIACTSIGATSSMQDEPLGTIYSILDVQASLDRIQSDLELTAELELTSEVLITNAPIATPFSQRGYRISNIAIPIEDKQLQLTLKVNETGINEILESGLRVTLISSALTLLLVLVVGMWLAQSFIRPILKLARVAQAVALGDLTHRANLRHEDEIGQLGRSFDQATETITHLLDQQAHTAAERQAILQSIGDGVLAVDTEEHIVMINPKAAHLLQQDADALIGQPLSALNTGDDPALTVGLQQMIGQLRSELYDPDMAPTEEQVSLGNRIVRMNSTPTLVNETTRTGAVVVIQDVTRAVESDRAKSEFIATASHELRTPLASLRGFVDVFCLTGTDNLTETQRMFLDTIKRQTDSMVQLVNDLLEVARLEQGKQRSERRWVQPLNTIDEAITSMSSLIEQRQIVLQLDLPPDLPPIWIDGLHLRRILTNLLSNAVKYVHSGGRVVIRAYELDDPARLPSPPADLLWNHLEERSLVIEVEDNGVGIQESAQPHVFSRFFRAENPLSVEVGGTGLGLAIARSLVALHEGQIGFWSVENQGSCFWVRLPTPSTEPLHNGGRD